MWCTLGILAVISLMWLDTFSLVIFQQKIILGDFPTENHQGNLGWFSFSHGRTITRLFLHISNSEHFVKLKQGQIQGWTRGEIGWLHPLLNTRAIFPGISVPTSSFVAPIWICTFSNRFLVKPERGQQCIFDYFWLFFGGQWKLGKVKRH